MFYQSGFNQESRTTELWKRLTAVIRPYTTVERLGKWEFRREVKGSKKESPASPSERLSTSSHQSEAQGCLWKALRSYHLLASTTKCLWALGLGVILYLPGTACHYDDLQRIMAVTSLPRPHVVCVPLLAHSHSAQQREEDSGQHSILRWAFFVRLFSSIFLPVFPIMVRLHLYYSACVTSQFFVGELCLFFTLHHTRDSVCRCSAEFTRLSRNQQFSKD